MTEKRATEALRVLSEMLAILDVQQESNWRRGIKAALAELTNEDGTVKPTGFENAGSIYRTMTSGGRGFAEYFIADDNERQRIAANRRLDELRDAAWSLFGSR